MVNHSRTAREPSILYEISIYSNMVSTSFFRFDDKLMHVKSSYKQTRIQTIKQKDKESIKKFSQIFYEGLYNLRRYGEEPNKTKPVSNFREAFEIINSSKKSDFLHKEEKKINSDEYFRINDVAYELEKAFQEKNDITIKIYAEAFGVKFRVNNECVDEPHFYIPIKPPLETKIAYTEELSNIKQWLPTEDEKLKYFNASKPPLIISLSPDSHEVRMWSNMMETDTVIHAKNNRKSFWDKFALGNLLGRS